MDLSPRQKVFVSILALGAGALLVDRAFLPGPKQAAAGTEPEAAGDAPASHAAPGESLPSPSRGGLAERLDDLAVARGPDPFAMRDAFALPQSWLAQNQPLGPAAERFREAHRLTGVMLSEAGGYAVIDGRCLLVGQTLEGFTLVAVSERSAVLESGSDRVELELVQPAPGRPPVR